MTINKPKFKANPPINESELPKTEEVKKVKKKEIGAVWEKETSNGEKYLKIKVIIDGKDIWLSAFKNNFKEDNDNRPNFVAWEGNKNK